MNEKEPESRRVCIFAVLFYSAAFVLFVLRSFYSVELTDEIHGIASIYNIYQGKVPFMTSWDYHTGWCLLTPLFWIYQKFVPDLEGIVLYFRLLYIVFVIAYMVMIHLLLKKKWKDQRVWYVTLPACFYVSASMFTINYNSFVVYNFILAAVLLYTSVPDKKEHFRYLMLGIILGACCITYPTAAFFAVFLAGEVIAANRKGIWKSKVCWYILGGLVTAAAFWVWIFSKGSAALFLEAVRGMFSSPHEQSKGTIDLAFLYDVFYIPLKYYFRRMFSFVILGYGMLLITFWSLCLKGIISRGFFERMAFDAFLVFLCCNAYLFQTDSDGQTAAAEFWNFWEQRDKFDMVIGWRKHRKDGFSRIIVTKTLKLVIWFCFRVDVQDANTPFRLMKADTFEKYLSLIPETYNLSNILIAVIYAKKRLKVKYIPVTFRERQGGINSINFRKIMRIGKRAVIDFFYLNTVIENSQSK